MDYYRSRGVQAIHDGLIVMRRRRGKNWVRIEEVPKTPNGDLGELILSTFAAHDLLLEMEVDEKLLAIRPRLAPHVRLEQVCEQAGDRWHAESVTLAADPRFSVPLERCNLWWRSFWPPAMARAPPNKLFRHLQ